MYENANTPMIHMLRNASLLVCLLNWCTLDGGASSSFLKQVFFHSLFSQVDQHIHKGSFTRPISYPTLSPNQLDPSFPKKKNKKRCVQLIARHWVVPINRTTNRSCKRAFCEINRTFYEWLVLSIRPLRAQLLYVSMVTAPVTSQFGYVIQSGSIKIYVLTV